MKLEKLQRRLKRLTVFKDELEERHAGGESNHFTYHAGFDLGYLKGQISILEDWIDEISGT